MPIYEYQALSSDRSCPRCRDGFETFQEITEKPLSRCPDCGKKVRKIISWCHSAVTDTLEDRLRVEKKIKNYEESGMWSHAAELTDKHSAKVKDEGLKMMALDNYKKADYDADSLAKYAKLNND